MPHTQYRFKFYFNATHATYLSGEVGQSHPHTWEVILNVMKITDNFVEFGEVEKMSEQFLLTFKDVNINTVPPFTTVNPTLENLCHFFKDKLQEMLYEKGWLLLSIELSETPSRSYMISISDESEMKKSFQGKEDEDTLQAIVDRLAESKIKALSDQKDLAMKQLKQEPKGRKKETTKLSKRNAKKGEKH